MVTKSEWEPEESFYDDSSKKKKNRTKPATVQSTAVSNPDFADGNSGLRTKAFQPTTELFHYQENTQKKDLIQHVVRSMVPRVQHHLDSSRISNVLTDMTAHLRVALLLPILLLCNDLSKLSHLGDDINRTLVLIRLQLSMANVIGSIQQDTILPPESDTTTTSFGSDSQLRKLSALKETFNTLCTNFRDTFDYHKLRAIEEIFAEELSASKEFVWIHRLNDIVAEVIKTILGKCKRNPYDSKEIERTIQNMKSADTKAQAELERAQREFQEQMSKYEVIHKELQTQIKTNQNLVYRNLTEVRSLRQLFKQNSAARQEDESKRHMAKMAKFRRILEETSNAIKTLKRKQYENGKRYLKLVKAKEAQLRTLEIEVLQQNVLLKTELIGAQDKLEVDRVSLEKAYEVERSVDEEFEKILRERKEEDARRHQEKEHKKHRHNAATMIQKHWKGYVHRKRFQKLKNDKIKPPKSKKKSTK